MTHPAQTGDGTTDPRLAGTAIQPSVLHLIGNTPTVALPRLSAARNLSCILALKQEATNPGGSAKDRPALEMILDAERRGELRPGGVIVEPTSGNTGVGLAIVAAQRGYSCVFVTTDKVAPEKVALLQAYGAEVVVCPVAVAPDDPRSYYKVAERLTAERGAYRPNQYANPANPAAHEASTGPEIWAQTNGRITHFVAGAGTSGTVTGVARYLRQQNPGIQIIVGDPDRSLFSGGNGRPYLVEGVGEDFYPAAWDRSLYDEIIAVSDQESFDVAREVSRVEGILLGGSGGLAVAAALRVAATCGPDDIIVVLNPDSGRGYLSRIYNEEWMRANGFTRSGGVSVGDVVANRASRAIIHIDPVATVRDAIAMMAEHGISQLPVCVGTAPFAPSEILGSVEERTLLGLEHDDPAILDATVGAVLGQRLPHVGIGDSVQTLAAVLQDHTAVVVFEGGRSKSVLSRSDLLAWYAAVRGQRS